MKKGILYATIILVLLSFKTLVDNGFIVSGNAAGIENGKKVILQRQGDANEIISVDSTIITDGKFNFKGTVSEPSIHFIQIEKSDGKVAFILENGKIGVDFYKDSIAKSKIYGTLNNDDFHLFNKTAGKIQSKMINFQKENSQKMNDAQTAKDTVVINALMKEFNKFQDEMIGLTVVFPEAHPKSFLSVLFVDNMFNMPNPDIEKIKIVYNKLDKSLQNTKPGKAVLKKITDFKSLEIGSKSMEFSAPNPDGKIVSLKQSLGKVTIIDFWASWCGPCRKENPSVVALYKEFHAKGLNIIGVSLDKDAMKWKEAIKKDNLTWTHVSNLKFWDDPIAVLYNIKSIPATFILDAKGLIIARDLRGAELREKIKELLK